MRNCCKQGLRDMRNELVQESLLGGKELNKQNVFFEETRHYLASLGLPTGDQLDFSASEQKFPDGADYRVEVPSVNSLAFAERLLRIAEKDHITINRLTETFGMFRHNESDILEWVALCNHYGCELVMSIGPRATYDTSATAKSLQGSRIGYRLRGQEQLVQALEDVKRGVELGVRSFVVYDEGALWVLNMMRKDHQIPPYLKFKVSAHCGHANPASVRLLESLGANSVNPVRDLQLPMIASIRKAVKIPLDLHTDNPAASGGFVRTLEVPSMIRLGAPLYLKSGNSVVAEHGASASLKYAPDMIVQVKNVLETINRHYPEAKQSRNKLDV